MDANHNAPPSMRLGSAPPNRDVRRDPVRLTKGEITRQVAASMAKQYGISKDTAQQMGHQAATINSSFLSSIASGKGMGILIGVTAAALFMIMYSR